MMSLRTGQIYDLRAHKHFCVDKARLVLLIYTSSLILLLLFLFVNEVSKITEKEKQKCVCVHGCVSHPSVRKIIRLRTHPNTAVYCREHEAHTGTHTVALRAESMVPK